MKKTTLLTLAAAAIALGAAACDRDTGQPRSASSPEAGAGASAPRESSTPSTPANLGQPQSQAEKREGANPVQQQVDPKQEEQQRDFRMRGEGAGPRGGG
jgi:hypothetical protein